MQLGHASSPRKLLSTKLEIAEGYECFESIHPNSLEEHAHEFQKLGTFCARNLKKSTSICSGDSGGPLVCNKDGIIYISSILLVFINFQIIIIMYYLPMYDYNLV